jgi:hypothetical protein
MYYSESVPDLVAVRAFFYFGTFCERKSLCSVTALTYFQKPENHGAIKAIVSPIFSDLTPINTTLLNW